MSKSDGWVAIDLDGTLAVYNKWRGIHHIGEPVPAMLRHVLDLLHAGIEVRIFTARVQEGPEAIRAIEDWCIRHIGQVLPVTNVKDMSMVYMLDDRAFNVQKNTGVMLQEPPTIADIQWHHSLSNPENPAFKQ